MADVLIRSFSKILSLLVGPNNVAIDNWTFQMFYKVQISSFVNNDDFFDTGTGSTSLVLAWLMTRMATFHLSVVYFYLACMIFMKVLHSIHNICLQVVNYFCDKVTPMLIGACVILVCTRCLLFIIQDINQPLILTGFISF